MMNGFMSGSNGQSSSSPSCSPIKTYFKTPEGKYKLHFEKILPAALIHFTHGRSIPKMTLAHLKEKPASSTPALSSSSSFAGSGVRSVAARLLGVGNGIRALGGYGSKSINGSSRASLFGASVSTNHSTAITNFDGEGTYLIVNNGELIFISDLNSKHKGPIKYITFSIGNPLCHAFDPDAKDGHDLLIAFSTGEVCSVSLRQQLQDGGRKIVGAQNYNKDGSISNSQCKSVAWVPGGNGVFVVAHADGNLYMYDKGKDGTSDPIFPVIKDQTQFSVAHARYSKSNPIARWHICQDPINNIAFSSDGAYLATVGRDGYLRVFDYLKEQLIFGGKSYYGSLLTCAWSPDGKYILTGGEDDLVQVWSMDEKKIIAWGEGHNSWVSGVAFDTYWSPPNADGSEESVMYRLGSVGQDAKLLLWDLEMDEIVVPLRRPPGGSPTLSTGSQSSHWDSVLPVGTLQPSPSMCDVPNLSPLVTHRAHSEPLNGLIFTQKSVLTISQNGLIKIWMRPCIGDDQSSNFEKLPSIH